MPSGPQLDHLLAPLKVRRGRAVFPATHGVAVQFFVRLGSYQIDKNIQQTSLLKLERFFTFCVDRLINTACASKNRFLFQFLEKRCLYQIIMDMECLVKTTDPVRLTLLQSILSEAQIPYQIFDQHISSLEAGIGVFPRRIMVRTGWLRPSRNILADEGQLYDD